MLPFTLNPMTNRVIAPKLGQARLAGVRKAFTDPLVIAVMGGPGCGKGTQCTKLVGYLDDTSIMHPEKARLPRKAYHINVGQLLRNEVAVNPDMKLPSGVTLSKAMLSGKILPSVVSVPLIKREIDRITTEISSAPVPDACDPPYPPVILLDGFPRTYENLDYFESRIAKFAGLIHINVSGDTMLSRVDSRSSFTPRKDDSIVHDRVHIHHALLEEIYTRFNFVNIDNLIDNPPDTYTTSTLRSLPMAVEIAGEAEPEEVQEEFKRAVSALVNQWY